MSVTTRNSVSTTCNGTMNADDFLKFAEKAKGVYGGVVNITHSSGDRPFDSGTFTLTLSWYEEINPRQDPR